MSANVVVPAWWLDGCRHRDVNHSMSCGLSHEPGCVPSCPVATSFAAYAHAELDGTQRTVLRLLAERDTLTAQLAEAHRTADRLRDVNQAAREELAIVTGERDEARKDHGRTGDALHAFRREAAAAWASFDRVYDDRCAVRDALAATHLESAPDAAKRVIGERDEALAKLAAHRCPRRGKRAREVVRTAIVQGRHILAATFRYADCTTHDAACVALAKSVDARKARGR